ncbi:MAG: hypothetical protein L3K14_08260 [Thermoplasmata archaeon]|nr:hypothetical protein [Thermoplasmata archaeon]
MGYYSLRLCAGGGAFEAVPSPRLTLHLRQVKGTLESNGIPVVDARVMLIAQLQREVTLSRDGRVLIKTRDNDEASVVFHRLRKLLDLPEVEDRA